MCTERARLREAGTAQRGVTLVELIVFIVIVSVGVVGLLAATGTLTRYSADPMIRKQMSAVAESLLREVLAQPFTYCDPDDPQAASAQSTAACTGGAVASQDKGGAALSAPTPAAETRYATAAGAQFDNVADYGGAASASGGLHSPIDDITGNPLPGYTASIAVARVGAAFGLADDAALQVTVSVAHAGADDFVLSGYRFRYAPRSF